MSVISPEPMPEMMFASPRGPLGATFPLTLSGNEITDGVRAAALQGDGRSPDGSMGIWEATTNLCANGGFETALSSGDTWAARGTGVSVARVTSDAKFGAACASCTMGASWQSDWGIAILGTDIPVSPSTVYTVSAWVKSDGVKAVTIKVYERDGGGTPIGSPIIGQSSTSLSWTKVSLTYTSNASAAYAQLIIGTSGSSDVSFTFYVDGVQVEQQPLATPYVETNGATASRSQAGVQAPASLIDETQGWIAARIRYPWAAASVNTAPTGAPRVFNWGNYASDFLALAVENIAGAKFTLSRHATVDTNRCNVAATFAAGDTVTVIAAWTSTTLKLSVNGAAFTSQAQADIPVIPETLFYIGRDITSVQTGDEDFFWVACGLGTLTDADAAAIHANGNPEPPPGLFPDAADLTMIWKPRNQIARRFTP